MSKNKVEKAKSLLEAKNIKNKSTGKRIKNISELLDKLLDNFFLMLKI